MQVHICGPMGRYVESVRSWEESFCLRHRADWPSYAGLKADFPPRHQKEAKVKLGTHRLFTACGES